MAVRARLTPPRTVRASWNWHQVKATSLPSSMLFGGDRRMEAENYLASGFATRQIVESRTAGWQRFSEEARVWQPSRLKGIVVSPEFGTPYIAATQVYDTRPVPRKWLALDRTSDLPSRFVEPDTILVTRSGSVGRATIARATLNGVMVSDDLLRVVPKDPALWGWVYGYLRAPTVRAMMTSARYGHMIKHLEVGHLEALPLIDAPPGVAAEFAVLARDVVDSRNRSHELVSDAEEAYAAEIGQVKNVSDELDGFYVDSGGMFAKGRRLDGNYYNPQARLANEAVAGGGRRTERLSDLVERVFIPGRFKHVYGPDGLAYLDSAQILEVAPDVEKYVLSLHDERRAGYLVEAGTLLLPCSGQLHGIIGNVVLAGDWHENKVLTNHVMRVVPKSDPAIRIGYLQMVIGHPTLGRPRILRGAYGSSVPELSVFDVENLTVPRLSTEVELRIADAMEEAARLSAHANVVEDTIAERAEEVVRDFLAAMPVSAARPILAE